MPLPQISVAPGFIVATPFRPLGFPYIAYKHLKDINFAVLVFSARDKNYSFRGKVF